MLSFIIPAFNEEKEIGPVIEAIRINIPKRHKYEIIVVDNGSTDSTSQIAQLKGANLVSKPGINVGAARNAGASSAGGDILIFLDADIYLTQEWCDEISQTILDLRTNPLILTGSTCSIRDMSNWIERCWFHGLKNRKQKNYINSGHLIISKKLFGMIGGFNEKIETGEDVDLSIRAVQMGAKIIDNDKLRVIHSGYPKTIIDFFRRERWHGRGDYSSLENVLHSKPALLSLFQFILLLLALSILIIFQTWIPVFFYVLILLGQSFIATIYRFRQIHSCLLGRILLFVVYFQARAISFIDILFHYPFIRKYGDN